MATGGAVAQAVKTLAAKAANGKNPCQRRGAALGATWCDSWRISGKLACGAHAPSRHNARGPHFADRNSAARRAGDTRRRVDARRRYPPGIVRVLIKNDNNS